ncbi:MAG: hypothetical protein ABIR79_22165 [Candidatus Binatia bacterium]
MAPLRSSVVGGVRMALTGLTICIAAGCRSETPPHPTPTASPQMATGAVSGWPPPGTTPSAPHQPAAADDPTRAVRDAPPTAPAAPFSQRDARRLVEHVAKERLGRDLGAQDYDRLADAVMRLRAAALALRRSPDPQVREQQGTALRDALAEIQEIAGVPASDLGLLDTTESATDGAP